ncbi:MAG: C/D box methylation guide ribonucleoprotein complex aNOP56 subunit [Candidatus Bathyarchaeota archaeon]|nr:C/D box methylation guide ribonucleoprotein complex aNOP56 subunit [Candidatus Bathyarchaeota archaeon]
MMKAIIIQFPFGVVAFDEQGKIADKMLFSNKPLAAAKSILNIESGKISEVASLLKALQNRGYETFIFENTALATAAQQKLGINTEALKVSEAAALRSRMEQVAVETGFAKEAKALAEWNRSVSMELAKLRVKGAIEKRDLIIAQAIQALDDLDKTLNLFMGRLREWYGIHFPELDRLVEKHETYARLVAKVGYRDNFSIETLEKEGIPKEKAEAIAKAADLSMGADMAEQDLAEIQSLSTEVLSMYKLRDDLESYIDRTMEEVAPNTRALAGALLGARLIAIAGSLQNLAMRPASTIQVLGAEKALFRSLKTGARPPKHGLIFQHTLLHDAKRWQRGKIARVLAGKLTIAARADAFGGKYVGDALKADIEKRLAEIREKYKEPPPPKEKKPKIELGKQKPMHKEQQRQDKRWRKNKRERKG